MLSFCLFSSSTWRCALARRRSASDLVSASSWSAWALAWATIWSAFFLALLTSCRECWSASRRVCSAWALALAGPLLGRGGPLLRLGDQLLRR